MILSVLAHSRSFKGAIKEWVQSMNACPTFNGALLGLISRFLVLDTLGDLFRDEKFHNGL
jgi:hypothetical protein